MAFCTECGAKVPDEIKFCTECGKPMANAAEPAPAMAAISAGTAPPTPESARTPPRPAAPPIQQRPVYSTPPPPVHTAGPDAPPSRGSPYAVIGTGGYIGMMLLFCIPVIGWLACIIMAFASRNRNRRNFARAMLVFLIIGIVIAVIVYFVVTWAWEVVVEYAQDYISEATGGAATDLDGLKDLFDVFKGLDGIDIPTLPGQ